MMYNVVHYGLAKKQMMCSKTNVDRHHYFKPSNIPKTEGGHIYLINVTTL